MFGDCRIDEVKDRLRSVGFPRVAGCGGHGDGYRDDRALRVRCRDSLEDPDNVVNDRRASYFCELLKQRERTGGEFAETSPGASAVIFRFRETTAATRAARLKASCPSAVVPAAGPRRRPGG